MQFKVTRHLGTPDPHDMATIEHIIPLSEGGSEDMDNLALAHKLCNSSRAGRKARPSEGWVRIPGFCRIKNYCDIPANNGEDRRA